MGCLLLLLLVGLTNNDALLLAFFFLGRPIWPTCMLASCSMYVVGLALSRHQHALCTHVPAATCCQPQQTRHSGGTPSSCGFPAVAVSLAGAPITPPPPPMRRASLHLRAPPSTLTVEYKRRRNFSDFVRSSLLLPTLLLSSIVHANMHATTRRDKASLCSSLFALSRRRAVCYASLSH